MTALEIFVDIEKRRKNIGLRKVDMAKAAGVTPRAYHYWVTDNRCPHYDTLVTLRDFVKAKEERLGISHD